MTAKKAVVSETRPSLIAKELVDFACLQGYRVDELVKIIEDVG